MGWQYQDFADVLPFGYLVADGVMLTAQARFFRSIEVVPKDFAFRSEDEWNSFNNLLKTSCSLMGAGWSVWVDIDHYRENHLELFTSDKAPEAARLFDLYHSEAVASYFKTRFVITYCYTIPNGGAQLFGVKTPPPKNISRKAAQSLKDRKDIDEALAGFMETTNDIGALFGAAYEEAKMYNSEELLTFLHSLISDRELVKVPETPAFLDYYLADRVLRADSITQLDDEYVLTAAVHDFPDETRASALAYLLTRPFNFRVSTRFNFFSKEDSKKKIDEVRTSHYMKRKGAGGMLGEAVFNEQATLLDTEALEYVTEADDAMASLARSGTLFGTMTTVIVVRGYNYEKSKQILDHLRSIMRESGFVVRLETMNTTEAFLGTIPGNVEMNSRRYVMSTSNLIHMFPQSKAWFGIKTNSHLLEHFDADAPHIVCKSSGGLFYLNKNVGDVGHSLVIGPSGSGKSVYLNVEVIEWLAHYDKSRVVMFDVDKTAKANCLNNGGAFYDFGSMDSPKLLNPFWDLSVDLDDNEDGGRNNETYAAKLANLFVMYFQSLDIQITPEYRLAIMDAVNSMATIERSNRSFAVFADTLRSHTKQFDAAIQPFVDGQYRDLFFTEDDSFTDNRFLLFEMRTLMDKDDAIVRFVFEYLFLKIEPLFDKTSHFLLHIDEGWKLLAHPSFVGHFQDWLRTLRKKHVYCTLATQQIGELQGPIFETIANQCQTRIFLPNPQAKKFRNLYSTLGLEDEDLDFLVSAVPKRDYLYASSNGKQIFNLGLDAQQLALILKPMAVPV